MFYLLFISDEQNEIAAIERKSNANLWKVTYSYSYCIETLNSVVLILLQRKMLTWLATTVKQVVIQS